MKNARPTGSDDRNVLEFDFGVRVYPPAKLDGYWRVRWEERRMPKDTTARNRSAALAKASEIVERLARGAPTELGRATGADLVGHYLDPVRRSPRVKAWSIRHRDEQTRYCNHYVLPVIAVTPCRELTSDDFQLILDKAPTKSVAKHIKSCLTGVINVGLETQDIYIRVRHDMFDRFFQATCDLDQDNRP